MANFLTSLSQQIYKIGEWRGARRWLLLFIVIVLIAAIGYATFRLSSHFEGFERYGYIGAFLIAFICSTTIIFPTPGVVVIFAMAASPTFSWAWVALAAAIGGALGEFTAYLAGYAGTIAVAPQQSQWYQRAEGWMKRYGSITIFAFALAPFLPFDVAGIAAGTLKFPFWKFVAATIAGRIPRSFIGCYLAYLGWESLPVFGAFLGRLAPWVWVLIAFVVAAIIAGIVIVIVRKRRAHA